MAFLAALGSAFASAAPALVSAGASLFGGKKNRESNKKINRELMAQTERWNQQQQANYREQFDYQKYLNENQYQIQAVDQAKAGINPIAANSGSLQTFSGNVSPDMANLSPDDYSDISAAGAAIAQSLTHIQDMKQQARLAREANATQRYVADTNAEATKYAAEQSAGASRYGTDVSADVARLDRESRESVASAERRLKSDIAKMDDDTKRYLSVESAELRKALQTAEHDWFESDGRRKALRALEDTLLDARRIDALNRYADFAIVPIESPSTGEVINMTLDDAIKYYEANAALYDNNTRAARDFRDTVFGAFRAFGSLLNPFGSALDRESRERMDSANRDSRERMERERRRR